MGASGEADVRVPPPAGGRRAAPGAWRAVGFAGLLTLVVWAAFSWPLPRHAFDGIPASAHNVEQGNVRRMVAGDHLQAHYFYWLFSDMLAGRTPFWHNLYEFNAGDDAARYSSGAYNMPLSFIYAAGRAVGGAAFGWNLTGFLTLWGTLLATWFLVRRYTGDAWWSWVAALLAIALPYRWIALLGGSPTGLAMVWVPMLLLGLDRAGRDDSHGGAWLAAAALVLLYATDPHTFYFGVFAVPLAYMAGFVRRSRFPWNTSGGWGAFVLAIAPVAVTVVGLGLLGQAAKGAVFTETSMAAGRSVGEVLLFTPRLRGLVGWHANPVDDQIFIGWTLPIFFAVHLGVVVLGRGGSRRGWRGQHVLLLVLLYGTLVAALLLAMGPRAPFAAVLFRAARRWVPGYGMIRQTGKIVALVPPLLAVLAAVAAADLAARCRRRSCKAAVWILPVLAACLEYRAAVDPTVCLLDAEQPAYAAIHRDAGEDPDIEHARALAVPLWPGDSHWSSLYQHYASLYRIRMMNGYSPIVPDAYRADVVERFTSGNAGLLDDGQLDDLLRRGVHYVVFHEDAFPERISAYPVVLTFRRLLHHPRLDLLAQGGSIWAFRIRAEARPVVEHLPDGPYFPSLRWQADRGRWTGGEVQAEASASEGRFLRLAAGGELAMPHPFNHMFAPDPHLWVRLRGDGRLRVFFRPNDPAPATFPVAASDWAWHAVPLPMDRETMEVRFEVLEGAVDLDMMTQVAGGWRLPDVGERVAFPGGLFFRSGATDLADGSVRLRPDYDAASTVFYGPRLPFPAGTYSVSLAFSSDAPPGTVLGAMTLWDGIEHSPPVPVVAGREAGMTHVHRLNLPLDLHFTYTRNAPVRMERVRFHLEAAPAR